MIFGLVVGFGVWMDYDDSAQSAIHQIYAVAMGLYVSVGFYIFAKAMTLFSLSDGAKSPPIGADPVETDVG